MMNKNLGFDKEHLIYLKLEGNLKNNYQAIKNDLLQNKNILNATASSRLPTGIYQNGSD